MANEENIQYDKKNKNGLTNILEQKSKPITKISNYALLALIFGISSIFLTGLLNTSIGRYIIFLIPATTISAFILGFIAILDTKAKKGNIKHFMIALAGIFTPIVWILILVSFYISACVLEVQQRIQLFFIGCSTESFNSDFDRYPPSDALDPFGKNYCGAMKLCEALVGQDLSGFHKESVFRSDGMNSESTVKLYQEKTKEYYPNVIRKPYLKIEDANPYRLEDIFKNTGPFNGSNYVIYDEYKKKRHSGKRIGMPILYYKADTSKTAHDINDPNNPENIYNYKDNHALLALGVPGQPGKKHPLFEDPTIFYKMTKNYRVTTQSKPNRADTYILLSAGKDGLYGTKDDIVNFDMGWKFK